MGRPWAERIKPLLGSIVVENIGGAGASLGASTVAKARPDGYTILLGGTLPHVNEALLKARPLYDPNKDLDPIMQLALGSLCFAVHPSVPVRALDELVAHVKANPGKISYGHVGVGSTNHLVGEMFKSVAGILIETGFEATPDSDPESFRKVLADAVKFWEPLVTQLGLKID